MASKTTNFDVLPLDSKTSLSISIDRFPQDLSKLHPMNVDIKLKLDLSNIVGQSGNPSNYSNGTVTMEIQSENVKITK